MSRMLAALVAASCCLAPAWGQKAEGAAPQGKVGRTSDDYVKPRDHVPDDVGKGERLGAQLKPGAYIGERHRAALRAAWKKAYGDGRRCPPGWVKKAGACAAPGESVPWAIGEPLPREAAAKAVPEALRAHLPKTPQGHRYQWVGGDLLLVATASRMVVDAVEGLGR